MVSVKEWVHDCNHATGEKKITFEAIRKKMGESSSEASPKEAFKKVKKRTDLDLDYFKITDLAPLASFDHLTNLGLSNNNITDLAPLQNLTKLSYLVLYDNNITDFGPVAHVKTVYGEDSQNIDDIACDSSFYKKLIENDESTIHEKIKNLIDLIEDVHQVKFFYTFVSHAHRMNQIEDNDRINYIRKGIATAAEKAFDENAFIIFKRILEKALEDNIIDLEWFWRFDRRAELKNTEHASFIQELQQAVKNNTARIEGIEANIEAINKSVNELKRGLKRKLAVESGVSFMSAILNAVSFGVAGSALQGAISITIGSIVDFGDASHIRKIASSCTEPTALECVEQGQTLGQNIANSDIHDVLNLGLIGYEEAVADRKVDKSLNNVNALTVITAVAVAIPLSNPQYATPANIGEAEITSGANMNGPSSDGEESNGFSDDEEETIFDLIDGNDIDNLTSMIDGFETKDEMNAHFVNDRHGEDRLNSLKYAISKKNTRAVEIIGNKAKNLGIISDKKLIKYMEEAMK